MPVACRIKHSSAHHIVEPMDMKVSHRHLHITYSSMKYSDKTFMGMTTSGKNAEDVMDMCEILFGRDVMEETPVVTGNCNGNSPLVWDGTMLAAAQVYAENNQACIITPFILAGAMSPVTVVGFTTDTSYLGQAALWTGPQTWREVLGARATVVTREDAIARGWFGAVHPKYRTPYRSIIFLVPIALIFAEDTVEVDTTIRHHLNGGFRQVLLFAFHEEEFDVKVFASQGVAPAYIRNQDQQG